MRRSILVPALAGFVLFVAGAPAVAAPADKHHSTPAPVSRVHAFDDPHGVTIDWVDPDRHFDHLAVRVRRGTEAPRYRQGRFQGRRVRVGHHATSAKLTHLHRNTAYSVTVWTVSRHGVRSKARHTHFTTDAGTGRGRYSARFTDTAGHPLAGVVTEAESYDGSVNRLATSGREGRVALTLPAGEYLIDVNATNATGGTSDQTGYVGTDRFVAVKSGREHAATAIRLPAGAAIRIHVADASGRPVRNVQPEIAPVAAYAQTEGQFFNSVFSYSGSSSRTDSDGNATLRGIATSGALQVCVNPFDFELGGPNAAFLSACTESSTLPRARRTVSAGTLTVRRVVGGAVTGRVGDRTGHGFGNSLVVAIRGARLVGAAVTSTSGAFRVDGLRPGSYRLCAVVGAFSSIGRTGYLPGCGSRPTTLSSTSDTVRTSIVLRPAAAVTGTVSGPHGIPIPGAQVEVRHDHGAVAVTDSKGHFLAKGIGAGRHTLCADVEGGAPTKRLPFGVRANCGHKTRLQFTGRINRVRTGLDMHLEVGGALSGTVRDKRGRPVPFSTILALRKGKSLHLADTTADSHGRFALAGLQAGKYLVCSFGSQGSGFVSVTITGVQRDIARGEGSSAAGSFGCRHHPVAVRTAHLVRGLRLVVPTASAIRVTVRDAHGRAVAGVDATALDACRHCYESGTPLLAQRSSEISASTPTDSAGTAMLTGLRPGKYAICLFAFYATTSAGAPSTGYADRCSGRTFDVVVRAGRTTSKRLVLQPGGAVSGRITDANGQPLEGVRVHVAGSAADDLPQFDDEFATSDEDDGAASAAPGYYSTTAPDGTYTVRSVRAGKQLVCADPTGAKGGTSRTGYVAQCVGGGVGTTRNGDPVAVHSGSTTSGVDLALTAAGAIAGHVTSRIADADTAVVVFQGKKFVDEDEPGTSGAYRFAGLKPGTYTVCAAAFGRSSARARCYRDVAWSLQSKYPPPGATPVSVTAGSTTSGIDIVVPR